MGVDCDDTDENVWKLNSCNKCALEPDSEDWKIDDVIANATGLLKEMLDRAKQIAPNLEIAKNGNHSGAFSKVKCAEITIGGGVDNVQANSTFAFELSHIINTNLYDDTFIDGMFSSSITRDSFIFKAALFEAEGSIFSEIIKKTQAENLNDCEKNMLGSRSLNNDYSNMTLGQIKNQIRQNGDLNNEAQNLIDNGIIASTGETFTQRYGKFYDSYQDFISYYRNVENETNETIKNRFQQEICN